MASVNRKMKELYLEVFSPVALNGVCSVPLETLIVMFVYEYCKEPPMHITLVQSTALINRAHYRIQLPKIIFTLTNEYDLLAPANLCKLPVIVTDGSLVTISGLCSVLRHLIQTVDDKHPFLGFKQGCLNACTETSVWTKFCEIDIIKTIDELYSRDEWGNEPVLLPKDVARFEKHMGKPVKAHNIQKQKQDLARKEGYFNKSRSRPPDARLDTIKDLDHTYAEGHNMSLADLILLPCMHLTFQLLGVPEIKNEIPLIYKWYENLLETDGVRDAMEFIRADYRLPESIKYELPYVSDMSLYRSEKRQNLRLYSNQYVLNNSFEIMANIERHMEISKRTFAHDQHFNWSYVPFEIQLAGRDFPSERLQRKTQQLENMIRAVLRVARDGYRIVEFCAGSGYLGLVLAHCLPSCKIILVENKEESLRRAKELAVKNKMKNVTFCLGNIDYFQGHFNLGVSLHACGIATDLVIEKCLYKKASFICCPCCYGFIEPNEMIKYPRSKVFRDMELTSSDYFTMAHASDQPHVEGGDLSKDGKNFMNIIDADRCLNAREYNYRIHLSTLEPPSCTPKNNLLIGIPK